jgi:hypothetical protein
MKLHSKFVWERFATAIKIDRIPLFEVRFSVVSAIDQTGRFLAIGCRLCEKIVNACATQEIAVEPSTSSVEQTAPTI